MREKAARLLRVTALVALCLCSELSQGAVGKVDKEVFIGETLQFLNETGVPLGQDWKWRWTFGDGTTKPEGNATKYYEKSGTYDVMLTVLIPVGDGHLEVNATSPIRVLVKPIIPKIAPLPEGEIYPGQLVEFKNETIGPKGMIMLWNFGYDDLTGENVTHRFSSNGEKTVTLATVAPNNVRRILEPPLIIKVQPIKLEIGPKSPIKLKSGDTVKFENNTTGPENMRWRWDFGDGGNFSYEKDPPPHTFNNPKAEPVTYDVRVEYFFVDDNGIELKGFDRNIADPIEVTVHPKHQQPEILAIRLKAGEEVVITAEENYTSHVMVEVNGTYTEVKLEAEGFDTQTQAFSGGSLNPGNGSIRVHEFPLVLPKPLDSVSQALETLDLKIKITVTPSSGNHTSRDKTETIPVQVKPKQPAWLTYVFIAAGLVVFAFFAWMYIRWLRPIVPGILTLDGVEHFATSPPLGPKKGKISTNLGKLSGNPDYGPYGMTIIAQKQDKKTRLRISVIIDYEGEDEEVGVEVNAEYYKFGAKIRAGDEMRISLGDGKFVTYNPQQPDEYGDPEP